MTKLLQEIEFNRLKCVHFVGIGGIGMSSIAQLLCDSGIVVSGSDRAVDNPENALIFNALKNRGIALYPQDGSFINATIPDLIVYSTAIEDDNADFLVSSDIPRLHRAEMLNLSINAATDKKTVAVSGSCGKTSVTAWLTEALFNVGADPVMIGGGLSNRFISSDLAGNYRPGSGELFIFEADESDKSLLNYTPDYAILLNIGTDHYEEGELITMFRQFIRQVKTGAVISRQVHDLLGEECFAHLETVIFDDAIREPDTLSDCNVDWRIKKYSPGYVSFVNKENRGGEVYDISLPMPGYHSGLNALAVLSTMELLKYDICESLKSIEDFKGVWRRSDLTGINTNGAKVYDDYAHNVEKIISCINTAHEESNRVVAIFQPHGFKPLEFMRQPLLDVLEKTLTDQDLFCMLPVYYAGGTASFSPTSEEVILDYQNEGDKAYSYFASREELKKHLDEITKSADVVLVMGARDNSLSVFAKSLTF